MLNLGWIKQISKLLDPCTCKDKYINTYTHTHTHTHTDMHIHIQAHTYVNFYRTPPLRAGCDTRSIC